MKKILFLLILFVFPFEVYANNIEQLYKLCKTYQQNGFKIRSNKHSYQLNNVFCVSHFTAWVRAGKTQCDYLNVLQSQYPNTDQEIFEFLSTMTANKKVTISQAVTSFLNWAENNSNEWEKPPVVFKHKFLHKKFPCEYKIN